jgi:pts system N-acetylglucosamine-specific eiicba component
MNLTHLMQYGIIAVVLIIISLVIVKLNHKNFNLEVNKLVQYLGGKDNILDTKVNMSRFKVTLKDITKVDKEGIQKLGAKGIVEIDNQLKIIFGQDARALKKYINELK